MRYCMQKRGVYELGEQCAKGDSLRSRGAAAESERH